MLKLRRNGIFPWFYLIMRWYFTGSILFNCKSLLSEIFYRILFIYSTYF